MKLLPIFYLFIKTRKFIEASCNIWYKNDTTYVQWQPIK